MWLREKNSSAPTLGVHSSSASIALLIMIWSTGTDLTIVPNAFQQKRRVCSLTSVGFDLMGELMALNM